MAGKAAVEERSAPAHRQQTVKAKRFTAPEEYKAEFGVQSQTEDHVQGIVSTENVRDLLDSFGLQERSEIVFPFQHLKKQHGEIWRMRIEPAAVHTVEGKQVMGHSWVYMQDQPERVGGAQ
jgi:hypothetical protein